jgi:hypothetical protein
MEAHVIVLTGDRLEAWVPDHQEPVGDDRLAPRIVGIDIYY